MGLDNLAGDSRRALRLTIAAAALSAACLLAALAAPFAASLLAGVSRFVDVAEAARTMRAATLAEGVLLGLVAVALHVCRRRDLRRLGRVALAALLVQLVAHNRAAAPATDPDLYERRPPLAFRIAEGTPDGEPVRLYNDLIFPPVFSECLRSPGVEEHAAWSMASLHMNTGLIHGIGYPQAYSALVPAHHKRFWEATRAVRKQILDLLTVRHFILPARYAGEGRVTGAD